MYQIKEEDCGTFTEQPSQSSPPLYYSQDENMFGNMQLFLGMSVEALDSDSCWYPAKITGINESNRQVLVHFDGFNPRHDKWYDVLGNSIRPLPEDAVTEVDQTMPSPAVPPCSLVTNVANDTNRVVTTIVKDQPTEKKVRRKRRVKIGAIRKRSTMAQRLQTMQNVQQQVLSGLSFAIEGTLILSNERQLARLIKHNGGICKSYITATVNYVIIGDNPHKERVRKIRRYGIRMITEGDFINFAKRLAKPKGRQPSSGRLVKEKKKKMQNSTENGRRESSVSELTQTPEKVAKKRGRKSMKNMDPSQLKLVAVSLPSTTRADRNIKQDVNRPAPDAASSPSAGIEFGEVDNSLGDACILGVQHCLTGLRFGNDGKFGDWPLAKIIYKFGGKLVTNVTSRLDYLIIGKDPRPDRVERAISYGINLIDQNRLIQLIKDQSSALMNDRNLEKERSEHSTQAVPTASIISEEAPACSSVAQPIPTDQTVSSYEVIGDRGYSMERCSMISQPSGVDFDVNHQDHLYNQPYQPEEGPSHVNNDESSQDSQSGSGAKKFLNDKFTNLFDSDANHGDQANRFDHTEISSKIALNAMSINKSLKPPNFLAGDYDGDLLSKSIKRVAKRKLLSSPKKAKKTKSNGDEAVNSFRTINYAQNHSDASLQQRSISASDVSHEASSSSQNVSPFEHLVMTIQCPENCGATIDSNQVQRHYEDECMSNESECIICGFKMLRKDMDDHVSRNIVKHMKILGKKLAGGRHSNSTPENLHLMKTINSLQRRVLVLEKEVSGMNELAEKVDKLDKQFQILVGQIGDIA